MIVFPPNNENYFFNCRDEVNQGKIDFLTVTKNLDGVIRAAKNAKRMCEAMVHESEVVTASMMCLQTPKDDTERINQTKDAPTPDQRDDQTAKVTYSKKEEINFSAHPVGKANVWKCSEGCVSQHNTDTWKQKQNVWKHIALVHRDPRVQEFICKICNSKDQEEEVKHKFKFKSPYETYNHIQSKSHQEKTSGSIVRSPYENILANFNEKLCQVVKDPQEKWAVLTDTKVLLVNIHENINDFNDTEDATSGPSSNSAAIISNKENVRQHNRIRQEKSRYMDK